MIIIGGSIYYLLPRLAHYLPILKNTGITPQVQPKLINQTNVRKLPVESHSSIFIVLLDYDTKTGTLTQLQSSKTNGDTPNYSTTPPKNLPGDFLYKIEVMDEKGKIIQTGWQLIPNEIVARNGNNIRLRVITAYQQNATLKLYLQNGQLIWNGKMQ